MAEHMHIARLKHGVEVFEIVVDPVKAHEVRAGRASAVSALSFPKVFSDAKKGLHASETRLEVIFGSRDIAKVAEQIIMKGDLPVTVEQVRGAREQKLRKLIDVLHSNGVNPQTNAPHPVARLEAALTQAKFHLSDSKTVEEQVQEALKLLRPLIPIKFVTKELEVKIPAVFAAKSHPVVRSLGKVLRDEWLSDGSWKGLVEIPGGLEADVSSKIMGLTKGVAEITVVIVKE